MSFWLSTAIRQKEQIESLEETISILRKGVLNRQGVVQSFTDSLTKASDTISKLKELVEDAYFDGWTHGWNDEGDWRDTESFEALEKL